METGVLWLGSSAAQMGEQERKWRHLAPATLQLQTRADYWRAWHLVVTLAVACNAHHRNCMFGLVCIDI
jgi:hypothetical protein